MKMNPRGSGGYVRDANKHPPSVSACLCPWTSSSWKRGHLDRGTLPGGRSAGGMWWALGPWEIILIQQRLYLSLHNPNIDIKMSANLFCKANSELSHFSCSEICLVIFLFGAL